MKMVKKVLMGLALGATVLSFVGCGGLLGGEGSTIGYYNNKQNKIAYYAQIAKNASLSGSWYVPGTTFHEADDSEKAITGSGQKYKVEYANDSDSPYRAYKETALKHAGALIKVTFDSADVSTSKMGVIFDLKNDDINNGAKEFYILGVNPRTDAANFYVSKYTNVTDIQAENFGTKLADNPAVEIAIVPLNAANNIKVPAADEEGKISFYVYFKLLTDGSFDYAVLDLTDDQMKDFGNLNDKKFDAVDISTYGDKVLVKGNTLAVAGAEYDAAQ